MSTTEACERAILGYLAASEGTVIEDTFEFATSRSLDPQVVIGAVNSLMTERYVASEELKTEFYSLSAEAQEILQNGSQEIVVLKAIQGAELGWKRCRQNRHGELHEKQMDPKRWSRSCSCCQYSRRYRCHP
jgi:hypothetical protein